MLKSEIRAACWPNSAQRMQDDESLLYQRATEN
jgi:hypothetical protein